jgi:LysM repeat protein
MTDRTRAEDADRDLTEEFWGTSPTWRSTGRTAVTRRTRTDRTGPIERTRTHRTLVDTGPTPPIAQSAPEPHDPAAVIRTVFGHRAEAADQVASGVQASAPQHADRVEIELESRRPVEALADRLGVGAVDPLLLRLGITIVIAVLLVPLALSLRAAGDDEHVVTADAAASGAPDGTELTAGSAPPAASSVTSPPIAPTSAAALSSAVTVPTGSALSEATATVAAADVAAAVSAPTTPAESSGDVTERANVVTGTAAHDEVPAERDAPGCAATYVASSGDYWLRLADEAGISLGALLAANGASTDTPLYPGSEVCVPQGARMPSPPTTATPSSATASTAATTPATTTLPAPSTTTTAAPTTAAPTTAAPPATVVSTSDVQAMIREVWPDDLEEKALEVAYHESRYVATAYNGSCCYGVFQIYWAAHQSWLDDLGVTSAGQLFDARTNIRVAYAIHVRVGGWGPWGG